MNGAYTRSKTRGPEVSDRLLAPILRAAHTRVVTLNDEEVDWPQLVAAACDAWLGGIVLEAIERHGWSVELPQMQQLRWQASQIQRVNGRILRALSTAAFELRKGDVEVLVLKGAALNLTLYETLDRRSMSDLDFLVKERDLDRATMLLEQAGFRRGAEFVRHDFFPQYHYAVEYVSPGSDAVRIDLHVRPFRPLRYATIDSESFWSGACVVDVGGASVRVAADEEQFVHLAAHSAFHGHNRLVWLYDLCRLVDTAGRDLDWDRVVTICRQLKLVLPIRKALQKVENLWGPMVPDHIRSSIASVRVGWRDRLCLAQTPHDATRPIRHIVVNLLCMRGVINRFGYVLRVLLPDRGHMGEVYSRRHRGWLVAAHARRVLYTLLRPAIRSIGLLRPSA